MKHIKFKWEFYDLIAALFLELLSKPLSSNLHPSTSRDNAKRRITGNTCLIIIACEETRAHDQNCKSPTKTTPATIDTAYFGQPHIAKKL